MRFLISRFLLTGYPALPLPGEKRASFGALFSGATKTQVSVPSLGTIIRQYHKAPSKGKPPRERGPETFACPFGDPNEKTDAAWAVLRQPTA